MTLANTPYSAYLNDQSSDPVALWITITPDMAESWLGMNHKNRSQRGRKIRAYSRDMANGEWLATGDTIKFATDGTLIDGQHRLEAVIASGIAARTLVVWQLEKRVQKVLDTQAKRSGADALGFDGYEKYRTELAAMARIDCEWRSGGLRNPAVANFGIEVTNPEIVEWADNNPAAVDAAAIATRMAREIHATRSGLGYAILQTMMIDPTDAHEFWSSIEDLRTNGEGDPRKALVKALRRDHENDVTKSVARQLSYFFRTWNKWRDGESMQNIRLASGAGAVLTPDPH